MDISDSLHTGTIDATCPSVNSRYVYLVARGETLVSCENTYYSNDQGLAHAIWGDKCTKANGTKGLSSDEMNGAVAKLMAAGAVVKTAFCGPCFGAGDTPANNAFSIRHSTRNFPNREGSKIQNGQIASVALMDARSIAATAANKGYLTARSWPRRVPVRVIQRCYPVFLRCRGRPSIMPRTFRPLRQNTVPVYPLQGQRPVVSYGRVR